MKQQLLKLSVFQWQNSCSFLARLRRIRQYPQQQQKIEIERKNKGQKISEQLQKKIVSPSYTETEDNSKKQQKNIKSNDQLLQDQHQQNTKENNDEQQYHYKTMTSSKFDQEQSKKKKRAEKKQKNSKLRFLQENEIQKIIFKQQNQEQLLKFYDIHKYTFEIKNLISLFIRFVKMKYKVSINSVSTKDKRFQHLLASLERNFDSLNEEEKVLLLWCISKCRIENSLSQLLNQYFIYSLSQTQFTMKQLSLIIWSYAHNKQRNLKVIQQILYQADKIMNEKTFCLQIDGDNSGEKKQLINDDSNAKVVPTANQLDYDTTKEDENQSDKDEEIKDSDLDKQIEKFMQIERLIESSQDFSSNQGQQQTQQINRSSQERAVASPHSLGLFIWSLGKLRIKDSIFLDKILDIITQNLDKFDVRMLTIIIYQLPNLNYFKKQKIEKIISHLSEVNPTNLRAQSVLTLKLLIVSIPRSKLKYNKLQTMVANIILEKNQNKLLSPKFASEIIWWMTQSSNFDEQIFKKIASSISKQYEQMNSWDCTQCFYALCINLEKCKSFKNCLDLISTRIQKISHQFNNKSKSILLEAIKKTGYQDKNINSLLKINN